MLETRFKDAGEFSEGLAAVQILTKYGFIDKKEELIIKPQFHDAQAFCDGLAAVMIRSGERFEKGKWGYINKKGKMIIPTEYDEIGFSMKDFAMFKRLSLIHISEPTRPY